MWLYTVIFEILLILRCSTSDGINRLNHHQRAQTLLNPRVSPYWEHVLREFVFKTISPSPPGNNALHKRILEAPFFGGPFPEIPKDEGTSSVILSRGDVYHLPNGRWLLCQEGCVDCEVCLGQKRPTVKWILRRIKRISSQNSLRYDVQLTIVPQLDESFHMKNMWPRSYVYVTSQTDESTYLRDFYSQLNGGYPYVEDPKGNLSNLPNLHHKVNNYWHFKRPNLWLNQRRIVTNNETLTRPLSNTEKQKRLVTTEEPKKESSTERGNKTVRGQRPRVVSSEKPQLVRSITDNTKKSENQTNLLNNSLLPKLILGIDQHGQKQLIHIIPMEYSTAMTLLNNFSAEYTNITLMRPDLKRSGVNQTHSAYQRMLRRIFDSLNSQRRFIENFLRSPVREFGRSQDISLIGQMNSIESGKVNLYSSTVPRNVSEGRDINVKLDETLLNGMPFSSVSSSQDQKEQSSRKNGSTLSREHTNRFQQDQSVFDDGVQIMPSQRRRRPVNMDWSRRRRKARREVSIDATLKNITQLSELKLPIAITVLNENANGTSNLTNFENDTLNTKNVYSKDPIVNFNNTNETSVTQPSSIADSNSNFKN